MRDSIGGIPIIGIVTLFIVISLGYVAYNVNYTKAFRMKDKAIDIIEAYGGATSCKGNADCKQELSDYANQIGYGTDSSLSCNFMNSVGSDGQPITAYSVYGLICANDKSNDLYNSEYKKSHGIVDDGDATFYNEICTKVTIDVPIIKKLLNATTVNAFYVCGSTGTISCKKAGTGSACK